MFKKRFVITSGGNLSTFYMRFAVARPKKNSFLSPALKILQKLEFGTGPKK